MMRDIQVWRSQGSAVQFCVKHVLVSCKLYQITQFTPFVSQKRLCWGYVPAEEMVFYSLT